jgi:UDP-N-acetylmuramate dehydrogenase
MLQQTFEKKRMNELTRFLEQEHIEYYLAHDIKSYLTMGIGGPVPLVVVIYRESHLKELLKRLYKLGNRFVLLGGGSNIVFPDRAEDPRLTAIINRTSAVKKESGHILRVNSGIPNMDLMRWNIENGVGGMDFLAGIPGTIGGAVAVNAGAFGQSISSILQSAEIFDNNGRIKQVDNDYFQFQYRNSKFKYGSEVIVNVFLQFTDEESPEIKKKVDEHIRYRKENHPCSSDRSAGCFFKNPVIDGKKTSAGRLIEESGIKGTSFKTLQVADAHSNFIVNRGGASFADVKELEDKIVQKVAREKGITLEREVIYISPEGDKY